MFGLLLTFLCSCGNPVDSVVSAFAPSFPNLPEMATCYNLKFEILDTVGDLMKFYETHTYITIDNTNPHYQTLWSGDMGEGSDVIYMADKTLYFKGQVGEKYVVAIGTWICN